MEQDSVSRRKVLSAAAVSVGSLGISPFVGSTTAASTYESYDVEYGSTDSEADAFVNLDSDDGTFREHLVAVGVRADTNGTCKTETISIDVQQTRKDCSTGDTYLEKVIEESTTKSGEQGDYVKNNTQVSTEGDGWIATGNYQVNVSAYTDYETTSSCGYDDSFDGGTSERDNLTLNADTPDSCPSGGGGNCDPTQPLCQDDEGPSKEK